MRLIASLMFLTLSFGLLAQEDEHPEYLIRSIYFGGGSYYVDSLQREKLFHFIDSIPDIGMYDISIHSHTDNIGGAQYNKWLSQMRSESVIEELVSHSVDPNSIVIKDFGQYNPIFDNTTREGRIRNRRVDIVFWPLVF